MLIPLRSAVVQSCGAKAGSLGTLLRAGLPVPDGFVLPFDMARTNADGGDLLGEAGWAVSEALDHLGNPAVAVRSSAADEDAEHGSAAGQYETTLAAHSATEVLEAIRDSWESAHSERAADYRHAVADTHAAPSMAVIVQRLVDADVSGVMFTASEPADETRIEASWGLGPSVVEGIVSPDSYRVSGAGQVRASIADKQSRLDRRGTRLHRNPVPTWDRRRTTLDDGTVRRLDELGRKAAKALAAPQDVEWALAGDQLWLLQARPITAAVPDQPRPGPYSPAARIGTPGSSGTARGTARVVHGPDDFVRVRSGDILICPFTDPAWTPLLQVAAGVVTEVGGVLSHAAIVARELGIPAVLGLPQATTNIRDGAPITIDGDTGTVTTS